MVFGTFDVLHSGHINFFRQARKLSANAYLIVSVARDVNVKKIKGLPPRRREKSRLGAVKKCALVDRALLGGIKDYISHIIKQKPEIIALGYDQTAYIKNLKPLLAQKGLKVKIVKLKAYYPKIYKSSLVAKTNSSRH